MLLSRNAVSWDLESAPTRVASTAPFLNSIRVGMPRTPNLPATCGCWSTLIFATLRRPAYSFAAVRSAEVLNALYPPQDSRFVRMQLTRSGRPVGWAVLLDSQMHGTNSLVT